MAGSLRLLFHPCVVLYQVPVRGRHRIEAAIREAARIHGVDPALIRSVIKAESNFDANSTSPKGAMGLMQLMPETARERGGGSGYNPIENTVGLSVRELYVTWPTKFG